MTDRTVIRGDDYFDTRPIYTVTVVDDALAPFDFTGCIVRSTWRVETVSPGSDPLDTTAALAAHIIFDELGDVTDSDGLELPTGGTASDGILLLVADRTKTSVMPLADAIKGDVQITDALDRVQTVMLVATLSTIDGYTSEAS